MNRSPLPGRAAGRLLISGPGRPAENMAVDAAILACAQRPCGPTLRFYSWQRATLSLGYFQGIDQRSLHAESKSLPVVRRATGGGAIVHDRELTYSLVVPQAGHGLGAAPAVYRAVHAAFAECLADFSVRAVRFADSGAAPAPEEAFLCFQRRTAEDLIVSRYKVLGSAQRRGRGGVLLQHGSLLLAASAAAPQLPGIAELSGRTIAASEILQSLSEKLATLFNVQWTPGQLSAEEATVAASTAADRFSSEAWTQRTRGPAAGLQSARPTGPG
jgi:lipoyl(octanoyl) transferase